MRLVSANSIMLLVLKKASENDEFMMREIWNNGNTWIIHLLKLLRSMTHSTYKLEKVKQLISLMWVCHIRLLKTERMVREQLNSEDLICCWIELNMHCQDSRISSWNCFSSMHEYNCGDTRQKLMLRSPEINQLDLLEE